MAPAQTRRGRKSTNPKRRASSKSRTDVVESRKGPAVQQSPDDDDNISKIAKTTWLKKATKIDAKIIDKIFKDELTDRAESRARSIASLELNQYLEICLWPLFDAAKSTDAHLLSIIFMANEKIQQGVPVWHIFESEKNTNKNAKEDESKFSSFIWKIWVYLDGLFDPKISQTQSSKLGIDVAGLKRSILQFVDNMFQSLENENVRKECLDVVSLSTWSCLLDVKRTLEQYPSLPQLKKYWKYLEKQFKKSSDDEKKRIILKRTLLSKLLIDFVNRLYSIDCESEISKDLLLYCELVVKFLISLESQLSTRRYFKTLLEDHQILVLIKSSPFFNSSISQNTLFKSLVDMLSFYHQFPVSDVTGEPLSESQLTRAQYDKLVKLQKVVFSDFKEKLPDFSITSVAKLCSTSFLKSKLNVLDNKALAALCKTIGIRSSPIAHDISFKDSNDGNGGAKEYLLEVILYHYHLPESQTENINRLPIYPDEKLIFSDILDDSHKKNRGQAFTDRLIGLGSQKDGVMPIPKLNLQFLTFHDYLLCNFTLYRLESAYDIRQNIEDALARLSPRVVEDPETGLYLSGREGTVFAGWSRMATPIKSFNITDLKNPRIGQSCPSLVRADLTISLADYVQSIRDEWDRDIRPHDVLFLISVQASHSPGSKTEYTIKHLRGCEVECFIDQDGKPIDEFENFNNNPEDQNSKKRDWRSKTPMRTFRVTLDPNQYLIDSKNTEENHQVEDVYSSFNIVLRRRPQENNFKAVLESIRELMKGGAQLPDWLLSVFLGYGDPHNANYTNLPNQVSKINFRDTFLDLQHLKDCFPGRTFQLAPKEKEEDMKEPFIIEFGKENDLLTISHSKVLNMGPYPFNKPKLNTIRFTPVQVEAIKSASNPGLTLIVGPPGTGKTDVAVQIVANIYHNFPNQHTLLITHSNQALNQIFEKIMELDIDQRHLLRLGHGEQELETEERFTKAGRVNSFLERRMFLLSEVERLAKSLKVTGDVGYTCETAGYFYVSQILVKWNSYHNLIKAAEDPDYDKDHDESEKDKMHQQIVDAFPFKDYFLNAPQPLFPSDAPCSELADIANGCFRHINSMFTELDEIRPFELLRTNSDRSNYLLLNEAKIVAMTCTHAALKRNELLSLGFKYDNVIVEEAAQMLEIESFIPLCMQENTKDRRSASSSDKLKRVVIIGDHHQLPPVVKHTGLQKYGNMEQSLFTRLIRLGVPFIELDQQGRSRSSIASLYRWHYAGLRDLPFISQAEEYRLANPGFVYDYQFINVEDYQDRGESEPIQYFYQNLGEAEYIVQVYQYMVLMGYEPSRITILTTYNGQKALINDVLKQRCSWNPIFGRPASVATVDQYQGRQNDYVLLSLVRTKHVGHIRDVRRLIVAMSRARLGLYVFGRRELFENCYELEKTFSQLLSRPDQLALVSGESYPGNRLLDDKINKENIKEVDGVEAMGKLVHEQVQQRFGLENTQANNEQSLIEEDIDLDSIDIDQEIDNY
ncbi:hypothetical protein H4219_001083 [Mycoemilia scoparia]|uniref:Pre-mRNA-splicing factor n=1 Tax=Mycoemilia scoparia TaxID=417184 RepID=A0A9W8A218_9FUNG|nr:hypothetical protein H4219_001083 [Mycoemilia scoparia]